MRLDIAMKNDDLEDIKPINTFSNSGTTWARNPACWRYMDLLSLISILQNETIHFTRLKDLYKYDPQEGIGGLLIDVVNDLIPPSRLISSPDTVVENENRREIEKISAELSIPLSDKLQEYRDKVKQWDNENDTVYISSWHTSDIESDFMWRIYGRYECGFVLESSVQDLVYSFLANGIKLSKLGFGFVVYPTRDELIRDNLEEFLGSSATFMIKSPEFSAENEFRVFVRAKNQVASCDIKVDLRKLIHSIRISPMIPRWAVQPLLDTLNPICRAKGLPLIEKRIGSIRDI